MKIHFLSKKKPLAEPKNQEIQGTQKSVLQVRKLGPI